MRLRKRAYIWPGEPSACSLALKRPLARRTSSGKCVREAVAHVVEVVGRVADAEFCDGLGGDAAAGEVLAGAGGFGGFELRLEVLRGGLVDVDELAAQAGFAGLFGRGELALGQRDAGLGGDGADGFGEADVFDLHDEGEDVALLVAAEAVEVAVGGVDGEGAGLFLVEGAEAGVVLGAGFAQLHVVADDLDDVGLLLDELGEVVGHAEGVRLSLVYLALGECRGGGVPPPRSTRKIAGISHLQIWLSLKSSYQKGYG